MIVAFSDPGIMRKKQTKQSELKPRTVLINQLGTIHKYKQCASCAIIRSLRSNHCRDCDNCVIRFDHHCPWIGNCVGIRNYPFFYFFLLFLNILDMYMASFSIAKISTSNTNKKLRYDNDASTASKLCSNIVSIYIVIYCCLAMLFITGLFFYHTNLVVNNITTKEGLKKLYENVLGNPFKRSCCFNCRNVIRRKIPRKNIIFYLISTTPIDNKKDIQVEITNEVQKPSNGNYDKISPKEGNNSEKKINNEDIMIDFLVHNDDNELSKTVLNEGQSDKNNNDNDRFQSSKDKISDTISSYYCDKSSFTARNRLIPIFKINEISLFTNNLDSFKSNKEKNEEVGIIGHMSEKIFINFK